MRSHGDCVPHTPGQTLKSRRLPGNWFRPRSPSFSSLATPPDSFSFSMRARVAATGSGAKWETNAKRVSRASPVWLLGKGVGRQRAAAWCPQIVSSTTPMQELGDGVCGQDRSPLALPRAPPIPLAGASAAAELLPVRLEM